MKVFQTIRTRINIIYFLAGVVFISCSSEAESPDIVLQDLQMQLPQDLKYFTEELLVGEIADTKIEHKAFVGPSAHAVTIAPENIHMFIFVSGKGTLTADTTYNLVPESIAIPLSNINSINVKVPEGEVLHFIQFTKKLTLQDMEDLASYPTENSYDFFFTRFEDCEPYTEKIKSPNTVSRTVLPADIVPRVSLGTVEAVGPDKVGAHEHPMLDQLFLGLTNNDIIVHADNASTPFKAFSLLHIPIGSSHWVTVEEGKKMYYMWMDFFLTKEGQVWLKTHKPMSKPTKE